MRTLATPVTLAAMMVLAATGGAANHADAGDPCNSPDGKSGVCRPIKDCPSMLALLAGRPSQENLNILHQSHCGFEGNMTIVCCIEDQSEPPQNTDHIKIPPSYTQPPVNTRPPRPPEVVDSQPPDVTRHPNLKLLQQDICSPTEHDIIVENGAGIFSYPWIALLGYTSRKNPEKKIEYRCTGSLINDRYVLTAANCIQTPTHLSLVTVKLGEHTIDQEKDCRSGGDVCIPPPIDIDVEKTLVHPDYEQQKNYKDHDIGLVRLARPLAFVQDVFVRPVCLPISEENRNFPLLIKPATVAGWGLAEYGGGSKALQERIVQVVPLDRCQNAYKQLGVQPEIHPMQLCAGAEKGRDSCISDMGGPLTFAAHSDYYDYRMVLFGIMSFGPITCGREGIPGVYTEVSFYMKWILDSIQP